MDFTTYLSTTFGHKQEFLKNFGKGVEKHGDKVNYYNGTSYIDADASIIFGYISYRNSSPSLDLKKKVVKSQKGKNVFFLDSNAFKEYERILYHRYPMISPYANKAEFFVDHIKEDRWRKIKKDSKINIKHYREDGSHILILLNRGTLGFASKGYNCWDWAHETIKEIRKYTDRKIVIKPHAKHTDNNRHMIDFYNDKSISITKKSLKQSLENAWCSVILSSSAGVPSLIEGVPVITTCDYSLLSKFCTDTLKDIENPTMFDRENIFQELAKQHWSLDEIANGDYWAIARENLCK